MKQQGKVYHCCIRPALLYCCETLEPAVADEARLHGVEHRMVRMMCGVRLVDWVSTDVLRDRVGVFVKIEDMIIQSGGMVISCVETSILKYVTLWKLKQLGKGRRVNQGNRGRSV